ncbi:MAG: U32 family peptidase [Prevotella sp.]
MGKETTRKIELLAPARNLECGKAAIDHGADAVYIGATRYGARAAAGNSLDDIGELCDYAHRFGCKVYVTVNTIIYDLELKDTQLLIRQLYDLHVDAILVQDMGLLKLDLPPIELHASTQTDNRTAQKTEWLRSLGFSRVVLARELSIQEISDIHRQVPDTELEVFVHGALCVSYSGQCYASQHCFGRSANRGECAQFCRLPFTLKDSQGTIIEKDKYLLSLKDMSRIDQLEELLEAGVTSLKIEGRLKDICYVKNVVAAYSQKLNSIIRMYPDKYRRASFGHCTYSFEPDLRKTFNRGFTDYFAHGRKRGIASFDTPKAKGEYVGNVKELSANGLKVAGSSTFANGDGLCFLNEKGELVGFRVNRADRNILYPYRMPEGLRKGMPLYRNNDQNFEKTLQKSSAERKMFVTMELTTIANGLSLTATLENGRCATITEEMDFQQARMPQHENIRMQLCKLGNTPFSCNNVVIARELENIFIPSSMLSRLRRQVVEELLMPTFVPRPHPLPHKNLNASSTMFERKQGFLYNIANDKAREWYEEHGMDFTTPAYEIRPVPQALIMQCRHCLRFELGYCPNRNGKNPTWREPLYLELNDGHRFRLHFDCKHCQMNIYAEDL